MSDGHLLFYVSFFGRRGGVFFGVGGAAALNGFSRRLQNVGSLQNARLKNEKSGRHGRIFYFFGRLQQPSIATALSADLYSIIYAGTPSYLASPNARIPSKTIGMKKIPTAKPVPLPNAFASFIAVMALTIRFAIGTRRSRA